MDNNPSQKVSAQSANIGNEKVFWDPVYGILTNEYLSEISASNIKLRSKFEHYKNNPGIIRRNYYLLIAVGLIIFFVIEAFNFKFMFTGLSSQEIGNLIFPFLIAIIPFSIYFEYVREIQKDLLNIAVANQFGWLYFPEKDKKKWDRLNDVYPEIFRFGEQGSQYLENQFWGLLDSGRRYFWLSRFFCTERQGDSSRTIQRLVYAFQVSRSIPIDFALSPQNSATKFIADLSSKTITTESIDFNNEFHIDYKGDRGFVGPDILQVLSPDIQEKLLEHERTYRDFIMLFRGNIVFVSYKANLEVTHTNFNKDVSLDQRDIDSIMDRINSSIEIAEEILPCLDGL